jgi:tetratricopeptide (TPR) repeat protein
LLIFPAFVTLSCAASVSEAEFLQRMDEADRFIASGDAKSALKILNRLNRGSYSAKQRLGIYRRYDALGEFSAAETCLKKGLKDIPESDELSAVYAWHLLERGRTGEAAEAAKKLSGTRFGQLAAEIRMRSGGGLAETSSPETTDRALLRLFVDAYNGTRNDAWLMNAATLYALDGDIPAAAALAPGIVTSTDQAMFWGRLLLDTDYPREASGYLDAAGRIFSYLDPYETDMEGRARLDALKADAFIRQGDMERASEIWNEMCARAHEFRIPDEIVATAFYNLSRYAKAENRAREWYENLVECLKRAPDELFALDAYADYSFNQAYSKSGDGLTEALRLSGLSSRGMSAYEEIPRVPFEDVAARLKAASGRSAEHYAAYLRFLLSV